MSSLKESAKSQAMYSREASVILEHHDRLRQDKCLNCSAMTSMASSVTFEQPDKESEVRFGSPWAMLRMPWLPISQQCSRCRTRRLTLKAVGPKYDMAESVTWYAWRVSSFNPGKTCVIAATVSSAMLIQSVMMSDSKFGTSPVQRPESVISLQPVIVFDNNNRHHSCCSIHCQRNQRRTERKAWVRRQIKL